MKGLVNHQNNCYLNSALQLMLNSKEFNTKLIKDIIQKKESKQDISKYVLTDIYANLLISYFDEKPKRKPNSPVDVKYMLEYLYKQDVKWKEQQDSLEVFELLINIMEQETEITSVFKGKELIERQNECGCQSESTTQEFCSLVLKGQLNNFESKLLQECDTNSLKCDQCHQNTTQNQTRTVQQMPQTLLVQMQFTQGVIPQIIFKSDQTQYNLKGFVIHQGSAKGGHYVAVCINKDSQTVLCNDEILQNVDDSALNTLLTRKNGIVYLLYEYSQSVSDCDISRFL